MGYFGKFKKFMDTFNSKRTVSTMILRKVRRSIRRFSGFCLIMAVFIPCLVEGV